MVLIDKIIKEFCVTEKATLLSANNNKYTFEVYPDTNRIEIAKAVEKLFDVKVVKVNTLNRKGKVKRSRKQRGKVGRKPGVKRAIVSLQKGDKIDLI